MKALYILFAAALLMVISCGQEEEIPADIIRPKQMVEILTDVQLAEAAVQAYGLDRSDSTRRFAFNQYKYVFEKHKVSYEQFRKSYDFYNDHPEMADKMYDELINALSSRQAESANK
jgi:hypothetical protein